MDSLFAKIKERLEEKKDLVPVNRLLDDIINDKPLELGQLMAYAEAIEIVNQVAEETNKGEISDGYHTFNELYHHRAILFSVICNSNKELAWKSRLHDTGDMYDGMFIVGIETPEGQATYHYDIEPYWDMFEVKKLQNAPKWDGHTPDEAIRRIGLLGKDINTSSNDGWIPVSERLPERCEWYLVTYKFHDLPKATCHELYYGDEYGYEQRWYLDDEYTELDAPFDVIAWRELPAPYKPKGENNA